MEHNRFEKASPGTACVPKALLACRRLCLRAEGKAGERSETDGGNYKTLIRPAGTFSLGEGKRLL